MPLMFFRVQQTRGGHCGHVLAVNPAKPGATDIVTNDSVFDVALASITQQRVKLNPFCVEDQADLLQDIKLLAKEENL